MRGASILLVARFVPGGRTAGTFMSGRFHHPLSGFSTVTFAAGPLWAVFGASLGYLGGTTFHEHTVLSTGSVSAWCRNRCRGRARAGPAGRRPPEGEHPGPVVDEDLAV